MKTIFKIILIAFAVSIVFILLRYCNPQQPEVIIQKDTIHKTIYRDFMVPDTIIQNKYITKNVHDTIKVIVKDTVYIASEIITDHFAKISYTDTILNDSNGLITISDTLYMNRLLNRYSDIKLINTTKTILDNKAHLYIGLGSNLSQNNINVSLNGYLQKKNHLFGLGYNTDKQFLINYSYRIR